MTWAVIQDLYARYGQEYVNKLGIRRNKNEEAGRYVASESQEEIDAVLNIALEDAKQLVLQKLSCIYSDYLKVNSLNFPYVKQWHIRLTIEILKVGGDCTQCDCEKFDEFLKCNKICTDDGICLVSNKSFISASKAVFECECHGRCSCC